MALVVIIGGASCGKSQVARRLAEQRLALGEPVTAVAFPSMEEEADGTAWGDVTGEGMRAGRLTDREIERPEAFSTVAPGDLDGWLDGSDADGLLLLDSLGTAVATFAETNCAGDVSHPIDEVRGYAAALTTALVEREADTIVVVEQLDAGTPSERPVERACREAVGESAQRLVSAADAAYLCVAGRLIELEGLPREACWPED
jgi:adenosyl cobinamide kinase/adenosyl cobinamide phosphate guanylyltransferase